MKVLCVIPARLNSQRLPNKMLANIGDKPLLQWTYELARRCREIDRLLVAVDSEQLANRVRQFGGEAIVTPSNCTSGSDRVAWVAQRYTAFTHIINLQGDQPFLPPTYLSQLILPFQLSLTQDVSIATLAAPLKQGALTDPHAVKVLLDVAGNALYFSRAALPYQRDTTVSLKHMPVYHHMGVYAYTQSALQAYTRLPQGKLEQAESLEQLRWLEQGRAIRVCLVDASPIEVNTFADLQQANQHWERHLRTPLPVHE